MRQTHDRTLMAAGLVSFYAFVIGFTDNYVQVIAAEAGLWQFHFTRTLIAMAFLGLAAAPLGLRVRPRRWRGVVARSAIHGLAMVIYFGALAFLPVAMVAAGLFTAPIFVLLISRVVYGRPIGAVQALAVALGFAGVLLVLGPEAMGGASLAALMPILAGAMYAMGNIATREWCEGESAETLVAGFFVALGLIGALGLVVLTIWPNPVPAGPEHFLTRGPVWPSLTFWFWTAVQAAGSLMGVLAMIRAYQITSAAKASVMEYVILPASAFWTWVIWDETLGLVSWVGMGLIAAAGTIITFARRGA